jgi:hypothetical protein
LRRKLPVAIGLLLVVALALVLVLVNVGSNSGGGSAERRLPGSGGVFRDNFNPSEVTDYEKFLGHRVSLVEVFADSTYYFEWNTNQVAPWAGRQLLLGAGAPFNTTTSCGDKATQSTFWAKMAAGTYDEYVKKQAENLVKSGHADTVIRLFHEFNGSWFPDCVYDDPGQIANFKKTFRAWVAIYRSVPGEKFTFIFNPTFNPNSDATGAYSMANGMTAYPGDDVVDQIGVDVYDRYLKGYVSGSTQTDAARRTAMKNTVIGGIYGLDSWAAIAKAHNKKLAIPEWGLGYLDSGGSYSGGDDAIFINAMAAFIKDPKHNVGAWAFWEDDGSSGGGPKGVSDSDAELGRGFPVPLARAAFLAAFGGKNAQITASPTPKATATSTVTPTPSASRQ